MGVNMANKERVVFGAWGLIVLIGFTAQKLDFFADWNRLWALWGVMVLIGFGLMVLFMDLRNRTMQIILASWVIVVGVGVAITYAMTQGQFQLFPYMGAIWLALMGLGHLATRTAGGPGACLWSGVALLLVAAVLYLLQSNPTVTDWQFVITGVVGAAGMAWLLVPQPAPIRMRI